MAITKESEIKIQVGLDANKIPEEIRWTAPDGGIDNAKAKAMLLSVWDDKEQQALRIDLWTKDMPLDDMKMFFYQTLSAMSETFERATGDEKMKATMEDFCFYFAEKMELDIPEKRE